MPLILIPNNRNNRGVELGETGWYFDVTTEQAVDLSSNVASDPIEDGSEINDHITRQPVRLRFGGIKVAVPLEEEELRENRLQDAWELLQRIHDDGTRFEVFSPSFGRYEDMVIVSVSGSRSAGAGHKHDISIDLQEVKIAFFEEIIVQGFEPKKKKVVGVNSDSVKELKEKTDAGVASNEANASTLEERARGADSKSSLTEDDRAELKKQSKAYLEDPDVSDVEKDMFRQKLAADPDLAFVLEE